MGLKACLSATSLWQVSAPLLFLGGLSVMFGLLGAVTGGCLSYSVDGIAYYMECHGEHCCNNPCNEAENHCVPLPAVPPLVVVSVILGVIGCFLSALLLITRHRLRAHNPFLRTSSLLDHSVETN
jgi:hypothetical protein